MSSPSCVRRFILPDLIPLFPVGRADDLAVSLANRHYSRSHQHGQVGGRCEVLVLRDFVGSMLVVWEHPRPEFRRDHMAGINCSLFRNESAMRSSAILLAAEAHVFTRWPPQQLYTYVNPRAIRSPNPGYCFKHAGYRYLRTTARGYHLLVKDGPGDDFTATPAQNPSPAGK